jgi:hypothetical protein
MRFPQEKPMSEPITTGMPQSPSTEPGLEEVRDSLARTPDVFRALLRGMPGDVLDVNEGPGTWTPRQVLCHVLHGETDDWMPRVRILLDAGTSRPFTPFDREGGFAKYAGRGLEDLLGEFSRLRRANLDHLESLALERQDLQRTGRHPEFGPVTLGQLLACWVTHDWAHATQIARIVTRQYGAFVGPWKAYFSLLRFPRT